MTYKALKKRVMPYLIHEKNPQLIQPDQFGMVWKAWWIDQNGQAHYAESSNPWPINFTEREKN